ncbi:hypothetical protein CTheo_7441 [Ceratobasidium theobromae]|uniref:adenosine deaminase n=1 Tax=Ceratobasidium theobromae TaxID=1582974 RepID=A0A5N5QBK2_9AGAM|nr:hypothetical protein CTheo_7441 [Ceratobasidium theobromae]
MKISTSSWFLLLAITAHIQTVRVAPVPGQFPYRNNPPSAVQGYLDKRNDLFEEEHTLRFDTARIRNATTQELRATEIIEGIRRYEEASVWSADPNKEPGMSYLWAKDTIAQTDLFKQIKKMPKGGLLHAHMDAMCDASYLLKSALEYPNMHIRTTSVLNSSAPFPLPTFKPLTRDEANQYSNNTLPTSQSYVPGSWVAAHRVRDEFPNELGGPEGFDKWIINSLTISAQDSYVEYNTSAKIWEKFSSTFVVAFGLMRYEPVWKRCVDQVLVSQIEDGVSYVEMRVAFDPALSFISEDGTRNLTNSQILQVTQDAVDGVKERMKEQGRGGDFVGARVIYTATRSISYTEMVSALDDCLAQKAKYPNLVVGFDMASREDSGHQLLFFAEALLNFRAKAKKRGLDIPFIFHAGETLDDGGEVDSNLYDAFLLGTKRIGHGFSLVKHPLLMQKYKENKIAVEVCQISNELLRLTRSANTHPLPILLNYGVPVVLSSDDAGVFQNPGVSFDFYQAIVASNITNILSLGQIARQSLEYSSLDSTTKAAALENWERRWGKFIDDIVASG